MSVFIQAAPQNVAEFNTGSSNIQLSPFVQDDSALYSIEVDIKYEESVVLNSSRGVFYSSLPYPSNYIEMGITAISGGTDHALNIYTSTTANGNDNLFFNLGLGTSGHLSTINLKIDFTKNATNANNSDFTVFVNGSSVGTQTIYGGIEDFTSTLLGSPFSSSLNGQISNFKAYKNGALVRNLPLSGGATDLTGNSTPVATDVTFSTIAGYSPEQPLNHPRIGYTNLLSASNSTGTAVAGFPLSNAFIEQTYEFFKPSGTDSTVLIDLGSAQDVNYFGLVGRNMGAVRLESSTDNTTFTTVLDATDSGNVITMGLFATVNARYFKFTFFGSTQEIVKLNLGTTLEMTKPISQSFTPVSMGKQETYKTNMSEGGQFIGRTIKRSGFNSSYTFDYLAPSFYRSSVAPFINHAAVKPFFVAWCPLLHAAEVGYCYTRSRPIPEYMGFSDYMMVALELQGFDVESGQ